MLGLFLKKVYIFLVWWNWKLELISEKRMRLDKAIGNEQVMGTDVVECRNPIQQT
jgi:hypothetical protein